MKYKLLSVLLCMLLLCSCAPEDAVDILNQNPEIPTASELPLPGNDGVAEGRVLRMNLPKIRSLHPLTTVEEGVGNLFSLIFDPAIKVGQDGSCSGNVIESWELTETEEGVIYTFHIRKNIAFHHADYGTVDAEDLLYGLRYNIDNEDGALHHYTAGIVATEQIDELTFTVTTQTPKHNLLLAMSYYVVPKEYYLGKKASTTMTPVGTGAYRVESYAEGERMVLDRNDAWWKTAPLYGGIELTPVEESRIALGSDVFSEYELLYTNNPGAANMAAAGKTRVHQIRTPYLTCLIPNTYNRIMENAAIRKAIAYGIDRSAIISAALMGLGEAAMTPVNDNYWAVHCDNHGTSGRNKQQALQFLQEAGYYQDEEGRQYVVNADGTKGYLTLRLLYAKGSEGDTRNKTVAQMVRQQLAEIGIEVSLVEKSPEDYGAALQNGNFQMALCTYYTYQDNDISFLFEGEQNYSRYGGSELREAIAACKTAISTEQAEQTYSALQELLLERMPIIGLYFQERCLIADENIQVPRKLNFAKAFEGIYEWTDKRKQESAIR